MCFKCGGASHLGVACKEVANVKFLDYISSKNACRCPHCSFLTEKNEGCNTMTCPKCKKDWCWICGGKLKPGHFKKFNIFGCPGG